MARYPKQPAMGMPSTGVLQIHHHVKTFSEATKGALDDEMNAFFLSLEAIPETPIIQNVSLSTNEASPMFLAQIHYVLVS